MIIVPGVERWGVVSDPLNERRNERKVYEEIVNVIVDMVYKEFSDEAARLRIYTLISDNFRGMVAALKPPVTRTPLPHTIEFGEVDAVE